MIMDSNTQILVFSKFVIIFSIPMIYYIFWYIKPNEKIDKKLWGKLIYSKFASIKIYENGIKPHRFSVFFWPFNKFIGIYKLFGPDKKFMGYSFHFDIESRKNFKQMGLNGQLGWYLFSEIEFNKILRIIRGQIGNKLDEIYIPNRFLTIQLIQNQYKFKFVRNK